MDDNALGSMLDFVKSCSFSRQFTDQFKTCYFFVSTFHLQLFPPFTAFNILYGNRNFAKMKMRLWTFSVGK